MKSESKNDEGKTLCLVDVVKRDAVKYCSKEQVLESLNVIKQFVSDYSYSSELAELYKISTEFKTDYKSISQCYSSIGKWIKDNENKYFAKVTHEKELIEYKETLHDLVNIVPGIYGDKFRYFSKYRTVVTGYELTTDVPFKLIQIDLKPNYANIDWCDCKIAFIFSQITIRFFYFYSNYKLKDWDDYSYDSSSEWQTVEVEIKDLEKLKKTISEILSKLDSFALDPLRAKYLLTVESSADS